MRGSMEFPANRVGSHDPVDDESPDDFFVAEFMRIQTFVTRHPISDEIGYAGKYEPGCPAPRMESQLTNWDRCRIPRRRWVVFFESRKERVT